MGHNIKYGSEHDDVLLIQLPTDPEEPIQLNGKVKIKGSKIIANSFNFSSLLERFNDNKGTRKYKSDTLRLFGMYYIVKRFNKFNVAKGKNSYKQLWPEYMVQFNKPFNTLTISNFSLGTKYYIYIGVNNNSRVMTHYFTRTKLYDRKIDIIRILEDKIAVVGIVKDILADTDRFILKIKYKIEKNAKENNR